VTRFRRLAGRTKLSAIRCTGDVAGPVAVHQELPYRAVSRYPAAGKPLEALYVNHISYQVNDYKKVRDFYADLLGMKVSEDNGQQCRLVFGNNILVPRNRANGATQLIEYTKCHFAFHTATRALISMTDEQRRCRRPWIGTRQRNNFGGERHLRRARN
jgi:hypothetical protein